VAAARRHFGDRARRQDPSARRARRTLSRMARGLRSGDRQIYGSNKHAQLDHMGVAVVDGKIHAIAGRMDSYDFNTSLNAVYDPKTDGWSFRAPLPTA